MLYAVGGEHMSSEHRVRDTFDRLASEYDELKLRVIPGYRQVEDLALRYANAAARKRVLELGCGSAEWAATFLRNQPTANYVAVEFSPKMRDLASRRLESYRRRVQLLDQDLNDSLPGGPFDLVVSFFAIHHLEKKQRLVEEVFASLAPGGLFLYADITVAADPALERAFQEGWLAFMLGAGLDPERIPHVLADHRDNDLAESSSTQYRRTCERPGLRLRRSSGARKSSSSSTVPNRYRGTSSCPARIEFAPPPHDNPRDPNGLAEHGKVRSRRKHSLRIERRRISMNRRTFLTGAASGAAAVVGLTATGIGQGQAPAGPQPAGAAQAGGRGAGAAAAAPRTFLLRNWRASPS